LRKSRISGGHVRGEGRLQLYDEGVTLSTNENLASRYGKFVLFVLHFLLHA